MLDNYFSKGQKGDEEIADQLNNVFDFKDLQNDLDSPDIPAEKEQLKDII